jgi:pimeloyl-ACP methyl ester carboxylesterase
VDQVTLDGVTLDVAQEGSGRRILLLHGIAGPAAAMPLFRLLARNACVIAPSHPGFGGSELPDWVDEIEDLAYLYLDLIEELDLSDVVLVGLSMGGWVAAEMAVKSTHRLSRLVLAGAFGIKVGDRETRDIPDIFALHPDEVSGLIWHDRSVAPDLAKLSDEAVERMLRDREAAALYLWEPYMHNPKLRRRLNRIALPTLVLRGEHDGLVSKTYTEAYAAAIPEARCETIAGAGHVPESEQPAALAARIARFMSPFGV